MSDQELTDEETSDDEVSESPALKRPTLRQGSTGEWVLYLQGILLSSGAKYDAGPIDGKFGPRTRAAVVRFQQDHECLVDGIVGPQTWAALHDEPAVPPGGGPPGGKPPGGGPPAGKRSAVGLVAFDGPLAIQNGPVNVAEVSWSFSTVDPEAPSVMVTEAIAFFDREGAIRTNPQDRTEPIPAAGVHKTGRTQVPDLEEDGDYFVMVDLQCFAGDSGVRESRSFRIENGNVSATDALPPGGQGAADLVSFDSALQIVPGDPSGIFYSFISIDEEAPTIASIFVTLEVKGAEGVVYTDSTSDPAPAPGESMNGGFGLPLLSGGVYTAVVRLQVSAADPGLSASASFEADSGEGSDEGGGDEIGGDEIGGDVGGVVGGNVEGDDSWWSTSRPLLE